MHSNKIVISINVNDAAKPIVDVNAEQTFVRLSPFDVPHSAEAEFDEVRKRFVITLLYLTTEERPRTEKVGENLEIVLGKNTGKLYRIIIHNTSLETLPNIRLTLSNALDSMVKRVSAESSWANRLNYQMARDVLQNERLYAFAG